MQPRGFGRIIDGSTFDQFGVERDFASNDEPYGYGKGETIMKRGFQLHALALLLVFAVLAAAFAPASAAAADKKENDKAVQTVIVKRLTDDGILTSGNIQVAVSDSTITLTGTANTLRDKIKAGRTAHQVDERYVIQNDLTVKASNLSNQQLAEDVGNAIRNHIFYSVFNWVTIGADSGRIILRGWVYQPWYVSQYVDRAQQVQGVQQVVDSIKVLPVSLYDDQIRQRGARAIYDNPMFEVWANTLNPPIHIIVLNGDVILEGWVRSQVEKTVAANLIAFNTDAFSVDNRLEIRYP